MKSLITWKSLESALRSTGVRYAGPYFKDSLPVYADVDNVVYIINMASALGGGPGTHWIAAYLTPKEAFYFDSFGVVAPSDVEQWFKQLGYPGYYQNEFDIQSFESTKCGNWCVLFASAIYNSRSPRSAYKSFLNQFKDSTSSNEKLFHANESISEVSRDLQTESPSPPTGRARRRKEG